MAAPEFVRTILGLRRGVPNTADSANRTSVNIASRVLALLDLPPDHQAPDQNEGRAFEIAIAMYLEESLPLGRDWVVSHKTLGIADFEQYRHLAALARKVDEDETGTLRSQMGAAGDYLIVPDVTIGIRGPWEAPMLHASVSCKWTIRSDRVQNIRHEAIVLTRHRRGRQPHIVAVTAEPLPTRLASIARGTGEVDAVYHVTYEELCEAVRDVGTAEQKRVLDELIDQRRLLRLLDLPDALGI